MGTVVVEGGEGRGSKGNKRPSIQIIRDPRLLPYFLTAPEVARLARKKLRTIGEWCRNGTLTPGVHFTEPTRRERLFRRDAILEFLHRLEQPQEPAPPVTRSRLSTAASPALATALQRQEDQRRGL